MLKCKAGDVDVFIYKQYRHKAFPQRCSAMQEPASSPACSRMPSIIATCASIFISFGALSVKMMRTQIYFSASGGIWSTSENVFPTWNLLLISSISSLTAARIISLTYFLPCSFSSHPAAGPMMKLTLWLRILLKQGFLTLESWHNPLASVVKASSWSVFFWKSTLRKEEGWKPVKSRKIIPCETKTCCIFTLSGIFLVEVICSCHHLEKVTGTDRALWRWCK